jgi:hypothetical protein
MYTVHVYVKINKSIELTHTGRRAKLVLVKYCLL